MSVCGPQKPLETPSPHFRFLLNQFPGLPLIWAACGCMWRGWSVCRARGGSCWYPTTCSPLTRSCFVLRNAVGRAGVCLKNGELFALTIVAQVMRKNPLPAARSQQRPRGARKAIFESDPVLKEDKASIAVFPEGGTSKSGLLQPFRNGARSKLRRRRASDCRLRTDEHEGNSQNMFRRKTDVYLDVLDVIPVSEVTANKTTAEIGDRVQNSPRVSPNAALPRRSRPKNRNPHPKPDADFLVRICYRPYQRCVSARALGRYTPKHHRKLDCTDDASQLTDRVRVLPSRQHRRHAQDEQP